MTEVVEIYDAKTTLKEREAVLTEFDEQVVKAEGRAKTATGIGLPSLAKQDNEAVRINKAIAWCKVRGVESISQSDRKVWEAWLPTGYVSTCLDQLSVKGGRSWAEFDYHDGVPMCVRELIKEAEPLFSFLEIRTPEKSPVNIMDSALFGHIDHPNGERDVVLLARWGESGANFLVFDDIKRIVKARRGFLPEVFSQLGLEDRFLVVGTTTFVTILIALLLSIIAAMIDRSVVAYVPLVVFLPTVVVVLDLLFSISNKLIFKWNNPDFAEMV